MQTTQLHERNASCFIVFSFYLQTNYITYEMNKQNDIGIAYLNGSLTEKMINMGKHRHTLAIKNNPQIETKLVNVFKDSRFCLDHLLSIKKLELGV